MDIPTTSGIYKITCNANKMFYIGCSINLHRRRNQHWYELRVNTHHNRHLQYCWDTYGENTLSFEVLELCPLEELTEREHYWQDYHGYEDGLHTTMPNVFVTLSTVQNAPTAPKASKAFRIASQIRPTKNAPVGISIEDIKAARRENARQNARIYALYPNLDQE